jgi:hypothetical protein
MELVEPGSAVDESGLVVPWQEFMVRQSRQTNQVLDAIETPAVPFLVSKITR